MATVRKPRLGQNFLVDDLACHRIVNALGDVSARTVLEIGPGHGALTNILVVRCRQVVALELDPALAAELRFRFREQPGFTLVEGDVLRADMRSFAPEGSTVDVLGNLPYYITSDILLHLFAAAPVLHRAVLMMQREVAERVAAVPGTRDYGLLSATTQMYAEVQELFTLPPAAFQPPPEVHSTVVRLHFRPRFAEFGVEPAAFDRFLRQCFAQKRKTLNNNLRAGNYSDAALLNRWPDAIPRQARAEQLPLAALAELYHALEHL